ncbi:MAG: zinc-binding dehydrogenase [Lachnospiraceae bacterium]|nr:zinc-binding dehydrogenase [Lachnospiraceae bacterium]
MIPKTMKAVILSEPTPAEKVRLTEVPVPRIRPGWVLVKVRAFGLNHSEQILRLSEIQADYIRKPIIPGIECAGEIVDPSDSHFRKGEKVVALMGGMGRSFHGSHAEYALLPVSHVFSVRTELSWAETAAVPETYFTAWGSLFACLRLKKEDTLLIRGGTCALGYAAIRLAKAAGCKVIATTHRESKLALLKDADEAVLDTGTLAGTLGSATKALELVGPKTLRDTLKCVEKGGIVCNTGILGGAYALNGFDPIKEIPNGVYLTGFFSNYPTQQIMDDIFSFLAYYHIKPTVGACYSFSDIAKALSDMDRHRADGKIVVSVSEGEALESEALARIAENR